MEVILLEKFGKMGVLGDTVTVKNGFARNFLIPQGKAVLATPDNIKYFETKRAELEKAEKNKLAAAQEKADQLSELELTVTANAGEEGKLFGSIGPRDLADVITAAGVPLEKSEVKMPDGPIRSIGEYDIQVQLHTEVSTAVRIIVVAEA